MKGYNARERQAGRQTAKLGGTRREGVRAPQGLIPISAPEERLEMTAGFSRKEVKHLSVMGKAGNTNSSISMLDGRPEKLSVIFNLRLA